MQVPETRLSGMEDNPPPCFRCLFEKPINPSWCDPETCEMLTAWLADDGFKWQKYVSAWLVDLEVKHRQTNLTV